MSSKYNGFNPVMALKTRGDNTPIERKPTSKTMEHDAKDEQQINQDT